ncbi:MAG TPA: exodeoxyribonuclease VII small subunit [Candidatus Edwardsbacteria bacterium]|nr:exodeoxyribonuclease VII small subunit [Candidatus Edwardsbacteria bacterium]
MKKTKAAGFKFEQALVRVEQIVERMESGEIELDQALALYKEGTELMAKCQAALQDVQQSIKKLTRDGRGQLKIEAQETEE